MEFVSFKHLLQKSLIHWEAISDRIVIARFKTKTRNLQCYAPTKLADRSVKDAFYDHTNAAFSGIPMGDIKLVTGDLDAKVGSNIHNFEDVMGTHGIGTINENGDHNLPVRVKQGYVLSSILFAVCHLRFESWVPFR